METVAGIGEGVNDYRERRDIKQNRLVTEPSLRRRRSSNCVASWIRVRLFCQRILRHFFRLPHVQNCL
jgi:hypothetical protein